MMFGGKQVVVCGYGEVRASRTPRGSAVPWGFPLLGTALSWQKMKVFIP